MRAAMVRRGVSQTALAAQLQVSDVYISKVLNGHQAISMKKADTFAQAIGCRIHITLEDKD